MSESSYSIYIDIDDMGLAVYTPKYLADEENFISKQKSDTVYDNYKQVVLRILLEIQSPIRLKVL